MSRRKAAHRLVRVVAELESIRRSLSKDDDCGAHVTLSMAMSRLEGLQNNLQQEGRKGYGQALSRRVFK